MDGFSWFLIALLLMCLNDAIGVAVWYMAASRVRSATADSWGSLMRRHNRRIAVTLELGMEIAWLGVVCVMWEDLSQDPFFAAMLVSGGIVSPLLIGLVTYILYGNLSRQMTRQWAKGRPDPDADEVRMAHT